MSLKNRFGRKHVAAGIGAVLAVACGLGLHGFRFGAGLSRLSYDLLLVSRGDVATHEAAVVYLDEKSYDQLHQPLNAPWDRAIHAQLIDRLTRAGAKEIIFDIVFSDPNPVNPAADQLLAGAIRTNGNVILGADCIPTGPQSYQFIPPFDLLLTNAAAVGSVMVTPDRDMMVREHTPEDQLPSLSWAAAELAKARVTQGANAGQVDRWMNYYGPGMIPGKSYCDALDSNVVGDDFFRGKAVFVGARLLTKFAGERKDEYIDPFSFWVPENNGTGHNAIFLSGVEIQATAYLNLVRGDWLERLSFGTESWLLVILGAGLGIGLVCLRPLPAAGLAIGATVLVMAGSCLLLRREFIWFPWLIVCAQTCVALSWSVLFNSVQLYVEKRLYEHTLGLYLSPKLVQKFARNSDLLKVGAQKHELTLFFSDIEDFTSISEGLHPDALAEMMNQYFQISVAESVHRTDGTVVKYIGDAIFAFWNAPELQADHAFRACEAALHMRRVRVKTAEGRLLRTRIGIHSGEANVGNFGSAARFDYTALGENVNLASRLEGLNKHLGTECLISGSTKAEIGDQLVTRCVGDFQFKGFAKTVEVYELLGWPDEAEASRPWRELFEQALKNYQTRDFELALMGFHQILELRPEDGPTLYYMSRIKEMGRDTPPPEDWTGATVMKEK
jgi:adenylate cyclase